MVFDLANNANCCSWLCYKFCFNDVEKFDVSNAK